MVTASTVKPTSATPTSAAIPIIVLSGRPIIEITMARLFSANVSEVKASIPGTDFLTESTTWSPVNPTVG
ncbi:Uncharacterised protein [Mycobacteroides abscessus subsp. abscessus]|nr:Uncharacterised protein [Mycobacteroides abscessus subsp. abscessus]